VINTVEGRIVPAGKVRTKHLRQSGGSQAGWGHQPHY
jgi:hypothetical protein